VSAPVLRAVASPRRREILRLLCERDRSAGEIHRAMPDVTFGAVSLQLKVLLQAGLVTRRVKGTQRIYQVERHSLGPVATMLQTMWADALHHLKLRAELKESRRGPAPGRPARGARRARKGTRHA
jgi:DNA-binding transcriptional ArsR family regulator